MEPDDFIRPITAVSVKGFKSFADEQRLEIRPLTLLAGANSSGKSSALQPLLLLKQTLEESYDPGAILLNGPHVQFTSTAQLLSKIGSPKEFQAGVELFGLSYSGTFRVAADGAFDLHEMTLSHSEGRCRATFRSGMSGAELNHALEAFGLRAEREVHLGRNRCFFNIHGLDTPISLTPEESWVFRTLLHVPALRGNPARSYQRAAVGKTYAGPFEPYTASVILAWQQSHDPRAASLSEDLARVGLTWGVQAKALDATQVEIMVGRLLKKRTSRDVVNIADFGFGVSQVLPVLVALRVARPGQLVYIEQPEIHLHPRAVEGLAAVLADAALRDVRVVIETHSSLLLLAIQALVAEGKLPPEKVCLHWFRRDARGATRVESAELDRQGAYGDWPEDFWNVIAGVETRFLDAFDAQPASGSDDA